MVERRIAEDGSMLAEGLSGAIPPESFGTGRVCIEPSCQRAPVALQQHRLVRAPREPGSHRSALRHLDPPPWPSPQLAAPQPEVGRLIRGPAGRPAVLRGASVHCVADTCPAGSVATGTEDLPMTDRLDGTVALVTGASSGIGEATAVALAAEGARVAVAARRSDRLEALAERIGRDRVLVLPTDVTDEAQARAMVRQTVDAFGRLDTLVNNAGVMLLGPIVDAPVEEWRRMVELNLLGLLYMHPCRAAPPAGGGRRRAPQGGRRRQRQLGGRAVRPPGQRRLQRHQVRGGGLLRVAPSGGDGPPRPGLARRAGGRPPASWSSTTVPRCSSSWRHVRPDGDAAGQRHRRHHRLHRHPTPAHDGQRGAGATDRTGALSGLQRLPAPGAPAGGHGDGGRAHHRGVRLRSGPG